jgi:hypothetical protein
MRDACSVLVVAQASARSVDENRGYADLDAADPWPGWQALKAQKGQS